MGFGAAHIDADSIGHDLFTSSRAVRAAVLSAFGSGITGADGEIDRN
jgi:dephospho-CoA kinase